MEPYTSMVVFSKIDARFSSLKFTKSYVAIDIQNLYVKYVKIFKACESVFLFYVLIMFCLSIFHFEVV